MVVLLCVDASILASMLFAHLHVSMAAAVCPPPGAALPYVSWALAAALALAAGSACMVWAGRRISRRPGRRIGLCCLVALATLCMAGGVGLDLFSQLAAGLNPKAEAWSASVAALLFWQGFHGLVLLLMGGYVLLRVLSGRLRADARASFDNSALLWHYVTAQGCLMLLTVQGLPRWL
jgi:cytochrome c oxidase subunit I+III